MSSRYPILDNRPIDQWKVTELKEELKRRKLTIKGLKDDLIKRLDEALRIEREALEASEQDEANEASEKDEVNKASKDEANGMDHDPQPVAGVKDSETVTVAAEVVDTIASEGIETVETQAADEKGNIGTVQQHERDNAEQISVVEGNESTKNDEQDSVTVPVDVDNCVTPLVEEVCHTNFPGSMDSVSVAEELVIHGSALETSVEVTESVTEVVTSCQDSSSTGIQKDNGELTTKLETEGSVAQLETEDSKPQQEFDLKKDLIPDCSIPENQVSEVNPRLGSHVKSDSISCDSLSINEKNELKDNIIADNVKLEQDIIKPEMVEPSPNNVVPVYDESRSMDVREPHEKKASVEETINNFTKTNISEDVGYPEKLNLDRSSGDDSMEEDLPESKHVESKFDDDKLREQSKSSEIPTVKGESSTEVVGDDLSAGKSVIDQDDDNSPIVSTEKRKFHDQALVGNNEPAKRQRRWNSETTKSDSQSTTPATTPKNESVALKRNFSRSDSSAADDAPRDRIVPPSQKSPTTSLRIDRFLRPFTLKQVQELLGKTGEVVSFWMDHIKTHCYVTYSSVEEAIETRNAVYNLQWPPNGGRLLVAEYVDPQEVKMKLEPPPVQAASVSETLTVPPVQPISKPEPSRQHREQPPVPATLPPPPPLSKLPPASRERLPSPPPLPEKVDPPIVTLDDLFRKTRATPRIYYLPLSEEQVAAKLAAQGRSSKQ